MKKYSERQLALQERLASVLSATIQERGLKLKWVAAKAELDPTYVSCILNGSKSGSLTTLMAIGGVLGLELKIDWKPIKRPD